MAACEGSRRCDGQTAGGKGIAVKRPTFCCGWLAYYLLTYLLTYLLRAYSAHLTHGWKSGTQGPEPQVGHSQTPLVPSVACFEILEIILNAWID
jgi:hypothetical protein